MQAAAFRQGHRHSGTRAVKPGASRSVRVPVNELDQCVFVVERRGHCLAPAGPEDEAGFGAVDPHLLDVRVRQMLRERAERCHCGKDSPPGFLRLDAIEAGLFSDEATDELIDPSLIFDTQARSIAPRELGDQLGLDAGTDAGLDSSCCLRDVHGWAATASACSAVETAPSAPAAVPLPAMMAVRCIPAAAYTNAGACLDDTTTTNPPATDAWTSTPSAKGDTERWSGAPSTTIRSTLDPGGTGGASFTRTSTSESEASTAPAGMSRAAAYTSTEFRSGSANTSSAALRPTPDPNASNAVSHRLIAARPYDCI